MFAVASLTPRDRKQSVLFPGGSFEKGARGLIRAVTKTNPAHQPANSLYADRQYVASLSEAGWLKLIR